MMANSPAQTLDVTVLEVPARWGQTPEQLAWVHRQLREQKPGDVVVLPEAALTGYVSDTLDFDLTRFAEPLEGPTLDALSALASDLGVTVIGPIIERDGERCFNTHVVVSPDGALLAHYRKRHPWYPETWATPGDLPWPRFQLRGFACTLAICFDVHFLATEAAEALQHSDVLFFCSAWVDDDGDSRPGHLVPLAKTFGTRVVNANWGPGQPRVPGQGRSLVLGADGSVLARAARGQPRLDIRLTLP